MSEFRFHEMSYAEIGREFAQLQASRDRWRTVADVCIMAIGVPENDTDRLAVRHYDEAGKHEQG